MNNIFEEDFPLDLAYYIFSHNSDILADPETLAEVIEKYIKELNIKK